MTNLNLNKIKIFCSGITETLAKKCFLVFLVLFLLAILVAAIVFYKYAYSVGINNSEVAGQELRINIDNYQKMLNFWQERATIFEGADTKEFKNPF